MLGDHTRNILRRSVTRRVSAALAAIVAGGCGGGGGNPGSAGMPLPVPPGAPLVLALQQVASGMDNPVFLTAPAGDTRQFIVERAGRIRILQNGALLALPFLDISARVSSAGEGGLLSIAFDPQYAANGLYYLYYTDGAGDIVIERRSVSANPGLSDPTSALEILRIAHPGFSNHYGGLLAFGADGDLYLGTGDGGGAGDPAGNAQSTASLLGKLLRIDVRGATAAAPYTIPPTNPFVGAAGRRTEIWAFGLRNPWRFAFDAAQLYIADVGQDRREEVDISAAAQGGLNYGWNIREGSLCYNAASCASAGLAAPVFDYDHGAANANGCAIVGGYVYRGLALPALAGRYLYSDVCAGFLKSFVAAGAGVLEQTDWAVAKVGGIVSFGRDADGELYVLSAGGGVYKIVKGSG
ncbi:MAG: PQQ-dependent sugar dehydrogenase [Pseudomonadota bacterium]|nr:PQQ-dependent sugar dehydrogenase [Pseudomonadota bacterium]